MATVGVICMGCAGRTDVKQGWGVVALKWPYHYLANHLISKYLLCLPFLSKGVRISAAYLAKLYIISSNKNHQLSSDALFFDILFTEG